ncbi:MAG: NAD-dependent succinate-semialdehyde dehydrogenase [Lentisphaerae bacterium]|nr:NAD-dependent succinate-semialdehyde dehydrogenase [Lentisphaerota bacterium]
MKIEAINPSDGRLVQVYAEMTPEVVSARIDATHAAWLAWRTTPFTERAALMRAAAALLRKRAPAYAVLMAREMGKPVQAGVAEILKCAAVCEYYAERAEGMLAPESVATDAARSLVMFQPLGVILAVMPWNFPFWQVFRFAAPTLMAGNAAVLKHASNVPGCGLAIGSVFRDAGFPEHLFQSLLIGGAQVDAVIAHPRVAAATLTGSTEAGRAVARQAGAHLKKTVLELGGSDPYLILEDADLEAAADTCATSRLINSGQSCIAAKRFIVVDHIRAAFEPLFVESMRRRRMGDPLQPDTVVGPLARRDLRDDLQRQVQQSIDLGARVLLGCEVPKGAGAYYPPSVLTDVRPGMPACDEELFGPVAAIIPVPDEVAAIRMANASRFGLGAAVFTRDVARGEQLAAEQLEAGSCFVNAFVKSDPRLPFGGIKDSGYGRELGAYGIKEFVNIKTIYVA